ALHTSSPPQNHLGLAMAVSQRVSDLPWVLAIENRSPGPIQLAALPELLKAEITPPETPAAEAAQPDKTAKPASKDPNKPFTCGAKSLPRTLSDDDSVILHPGELIFHAFDPRELCDGEEPLQEGARVKLTYGFPLQTKNLWQGGKLTTVEAEQKAPFVAERKTSDGEVFLPLKHLVAEEFTLDKTYPLSAVEALPGDGEDDDADSADDSSEHVEPPPLALTISPLGTTSSPES